MPPPMDLAGGTPARRLRPAAGSTGSSRAAARATTSDPSASTTPREPIDFKVIVLGDSGVGKSALIRQYVNKSFGDRLLATVGCDFSQKTIAVDIPAVRVVADSPAPPRAEPNAPLDTSAASTKSGLDSQPRPLEAVLDATLPTVVSSASLQIWDTAGAERHNALGAVFYRGADACVLVCDVCDRRSFDGLVVWAAEFRKYTTVNRARRTPVTLVAANKADRPITEHQVSLAELEQFCADQGFDRVAPDYFASPYNVHAAGAPRSNSTERSPLEPRVVDETPLEDDALPPRGAAMVEIGAPAGSKCDADEDAVGGDFPFLKESSSSSVGGGDQQQHPGGERPNVPTLCTLASATQHHSAEGVFATMAVELLSRRALFVAARDAQRDRMGASPSQGGSLADAPSDDDSVVPTTTKLRLKKADAKQPATRKRRGIRC